MTDASPRARAQAALPDGWLEGEIELTAFALAHDGCDVRAVLKGFAALVRHNDALLADQPWQPIAEALEKAEAKHAPMRGPHEGYAVILEELDELWDEVKRQPIDPAAMRKEALHVGAMAARFLKDVCGVLPAPPTETPR